ncbi:MAG: pyridoxamine kinase [Candidatus Cloacimonadaceae bacterium]|nr:pyridoxamine kinase [Candidatus Cloacimonadaceae bacterium]
MTHSDSRPDKRILAVHDLSGFGHTSLMAIMPIMYRMGLQTAVLPSALLSANTDFPGFRMVDFGDSMMDFIGHWKKLGLRFDAIYTGFLGNPAQAEMLVSAFGDLVAKDGIILVDPVLGDAGKLYSCYDESMIDAMKMLVKYADIISPNVFEAAMLVGADPNASIDSEACGCWAKQLCMDRTKHCIITSVPSADPRYTHVGHYDREMDVYCEYSCEYVPVWFPGTGDCFSAFLIAGIMNGFPIGISIQATMVLLRDAIRLSIPLVKDPRTGIALQRVMDLDIMGYFTGVSSGR